MSSRANTTKTTTICEDDIYRKRWVGTRCSAPPVSSGTRRLPVCRPVETQRAGVRLQRHRGNGAEATACKETDLCVISLADGWDQAQTNTVQI